MSLNLSTSLGVDQTCCVGQDSDMFEAKGPFLPESGTSASTSALYAAADASSLLSPTSMFSPALSEWHHLPSLVVPGTTARPSTAGLLAKANLARLEAVKAKQEYLQAKKEAAEMSAQIAQQEFLLAQQQLCQLQRLEEMQKMAILQSAQISANSSPRLSTTVYVPPKKRQISTVVDTEQEDASSALMALSKPPPVKKAKIGTPCPISPEKAISSEEAISSEKEEKATDEVVDGSSGLDSTDKPRYPLTAYNFFFSVEREKILLATSRDADQKVQGAEDDESRGHAVEEVLSTLTADEHKFFETSVTTKLEAEQLLPYDPNKKKKRQHRKTHGKIGFVHLVRICSSRWKALPEERAQFYKKLAAKDLARWKVAMKSYKGDSKEEASSPKKSKAATSST